MDELKPCPWCGEAVEDTVIEGSTFRWRMVAGCCTSGPEVRHNTLADDQVAAEAQSRADAITAWNRRPADVDASQPQQGAVDAFDAGWRMAAAWADRDDLLADMDSSAYKTERGAALAAHGKGG